MLWLRVYSASQGLDSAGGVGGGTLFAASIPFSTKLLPFYSWPAEGTGRVAAEIQPFGSEDTGRRRGGLNRASQLCGTE